MKHPDERKIASYAGGDAGWVERFSTGQHIARCRTCRALTGAYRKDREALRREAAELAPQVDWERLAAEMTANIRVGLEAGACVAEPAAKPLRIFWRPAFAGVGLALVLICSWYLNFPVRERALLGHGFGQLWNRPVVSRGSGVSLEATRTGIQVSENGSTLAVMNPAEAAPVVVVSTRGSLRARYVDDDTGQVTITNVYAQ